MLSNKFADIGAEFAGLAMIIAFRHHVIRIDGLEADDYSNGNSYHEIYKSATSSA